MAMCMLQSGRYMGSENHHDMWNIVQDLCMFVSNQETFAIKSSAQWSGAFNLTLIFKDRGSRKRLILEKNMAKDAGLDMLNENLFLSCNQPCKKIQTYQDSDNTGRRHILPKGMSEETGIDRTINIIYEPEQIFNNDSAPILVFDTLYLIQLLVQKMSIRQKSRMKTSQH